MWVYQSIIIRPLTSKWIIWKMTKALFVQLSTLIYFVSEERKEIFCKTCWLLFIVCKGKQCWSSFKHILVGYKQPPNPDPKSPPPTPVTFPEFNFNLIHCEICFSVFSLKEYIIASYVKLWKQMWCVLLMWHVKLISFKLFFL